ncbi:hypothetical protein [Paraburkholderia sp. HD33-4]|uniref:hypothetical protein n=1 Tax=Paraburkholderia sp. HD33-4 TaxID=2883242 RepID=UPI001F1BBE33|nr:hypothetical protein [Paraburkholderia sp. HD33-4]
MHKLILVPGQQGCRPVNERETRIDGRRNDAKTARNGEPAIKPERLPSTETN